jgi:ABC-2 type transport system permease protein
VKAFLAVARNEITLVLRDRLYLMLMTVGAVSTLLTLALTMAIDVEGVRTLVVDLDGSYHSRHFVQALANDPFFELEPAASYEEAERNLQAGTTRLIVVLPAGYGRRVLRGETARVQVLLDGSEPDVATLAYHHVVAVTGDVSQRLVVERLNRQGVAAPSPPPFHPRVRYNPDMETVISVVPGLMAIVLTVPAVGASAAFARERERGTFEMVASTPLGRWPLLLGRVFPYLLIAVLDILIFTAIARFLFHVPLRGSLLLFILMGLLYVFATASSGVFLAQFMRTQHGAAIVTFELFGIAPTYLSNIFFPVVTMPTWLQWISATLPATHFNRIARGVLLKGTGLDVLWPNGLALLATGILMSGLAYVRFRKKLA